MTKNEIEISQNLLCNWMEEEIESKKSEARNQLFLTIFPFLEKWFLSICKKKGMYFTKEEVKSECWDCFEFCLHNYRKRESVPLPNFFYTYTRFFILTKINKSRNQKFYKNREISYSNFEDWGIDSSERAGDGGEFNPDKSHRDKKIFIPKQYHDDTSIEVYEHVEELRSFKEMLPEEYKTVFDDAIMSMAPNSKDNLQRLEATTLSYSKYHEVKKVFKVVVEFLLLRGE